MAKYSALSDETLSLIREVHETGAFKQVEIASMFNISQPLVSQIINGRWRPNSGPPTALHIKVKLLREQVTALQSQIKTLAEESAQGLKAHLAKGEARLEAISAGDLDVSVLD